MIKEYSKNARKATMSDLDRLKENLKELGDLSGITHDLETDEIITGNQRSTVFDINNCEIVITSKNDKPDKQGTVAVGYIVWNENKYNYRQVRWSEETRKKACIVANTFAGIFDRDALEAYDPEDLESFGLDKKFIPKKSSKNNQDREPITSDIKTIKLFFDKNTEPQFREYIELIKEKLGTKNMTETIYEIAKIAYEDSSKEN